MQAIIIGIGILGTGTIVKANGGDVHGLTTAAALLLSSGVGIAASLHKFVIAVGAARLTAAVLQLGYRFERHLLEPK